jgi:hypothetical protein
MNWEAIGAVAEAVGTLAVLISLIYVAIQIRQSTLQFSRSIEANQLAAFERNIESSNRIRELLLLNPALEELLLKGFKSYKELDRLEKFRFGMLLRNILSAMQGAFIRQTSVAHDPLEFAGSARLLDDILLNRGVREWLGVTEPDWRPEFRDFVDQRLAAILQRESEPDPSTNTTRN